MAKAGRKKLAGKLYYFRAFDKEDEKKVKEYAEKLYYVKTKTKKNNL